jgi:putative Holliday junction resolvase
MQRVSALGLDIGRKRIGVAGCDGTELLKKLVAQREAQLLVVGLPYSLDGSVGFQAKQVEKYAQRLAAALQLPLEYVDERLTSVEAEEELKAQKRFSSRDKGAIDRRAAAIILQRWLDDRRAKQVPVPQF